MSKCKDRRLAKTMKTFRARKVCTISELTDLLECSAATARRRLKEWKTHTSYNNNGKYYALPDIVNFSPTVFGALAPCFFRDMVFYARHSLPCALFQLNSDFREALTVTTI